MLIGFQDLFFFPRGGQTATDILLREQGGLNSSLQETDDVLSKAATAQASLIRQRGLLQNATGTIRELQERVPVLGKLIKRVECYKNRYYNIFGFVPVILFLS